MRKIGLLGIIFILLSGCVNAPLSTERKDEISIQDVQGNVSTFSSTPTRVISLSSSWAQIWQLAGGQLVGVTSDAITKQGLELEKDVEIVGTIKDPNMEVILSLKPDLVLLSQDITSHHTIAKTLREANIDYYMGKVETFYEYDDMLYDFTKLTKDKDAYQKYGREVEKQMKAFIKAVPYVSKQPTALFLRAFSTGVKVKAKDHIVCDILEDINVRNIAQSDQFPLDDLSIEAIMKEDPDHIFIVAMGDEEKAKNKVYAMMQEDPAWQTLKAVKTEQVHFLDKELYHYKPNERWAKAYETIITIVYKDLHL